MKLSEIISPARRGHEYEYIANECDKFINGEGTLDPVDIIVTYEFRPVSYSDHTGDGGPSERHEADLDVTSIKTGAEAHFKDESDEILKTFPKGTDIKKLPGYKPSFERDFHDMAWENHDDHRDDNY